MIHSSTILDRYMNNESSPGRFSSYSLDGIRALLGLLGNPERELSFIHVAGTNGKGSTCHMIAAILSGHGHKIGLFTSPHLDDVRERISVDGTIISENAFSELLCVIDTAASNCRARITYFDILAACAILHFVREKVSYVVFETGLGGRLDSTNIVIPLVCAITPIDFDHMEMLGNTLEKIAAEKAGIIKTGIPVVTSNTISEIMHVLKESSRDKNAPFFSLGTDFNVDKIESFQNGITFSYTDSCYHIDEICIPHPGFFQAANAACAIAAISFAGIPIDSPTVKKSLSSIIIPGRMETLCASPLILFDPAHNRQSLHALSGILHERYPSYRYSIFTSFMKDKEPSSLLDIIRREITTDIIYISLDDSRAFIPDNSNLPVIPSTRTDMIADELRLRSDSISIFTGSFRLHRTAVGSVALLIDKHRYSDPHL
jgi:dihydrofolate synthase/folylpolyglutamate synthase